MANRAFTRAGKEPVSMSFALLYSVGNRTGERKDASIPSTDSTCPKTSIRSCALRRAFPADQQATYARDSVRGGEQFERTEGRILPGQPWHKRQRSAASQRRKGAVRHDHKKPPAGQTAQAAAKRTAYAPVTQPRPRTTHSRCHWPCYRPRRRRRVQQARARLCAHAARPAWLGVGRAHAG